MSLLFCFFVILHSFNHVDDNRMEDITKQLAEAFAGDTQAKKQKAKSQETENISEDQLIETFQMLVSQSKFGISEREVISAIKSSEQKSRELEEAKEVVSAEFEGHNYIEVGGLQQQGFDISLPSLALFKGSSYQLSPKAKSLLDEVSQTIRTYSDLMQIEIIGHSDARQNRFSEFTLSAQRAASVATYLIATGIPEDKIAIRSRGAAQPLYLKKGGANDRIHLRLTRKADKG